MCHCSILVIWLVKDVLASSLFTKPSLRHLQMACLPQYLIDPRAPQIRHASNLQEVQSQVGQLVLKGHHLSFTKDGTKLMARVLRL